MQFDVYADLDHLYMINFSVDATRLARLVPPPLRLLRKRGRGFPSIVLPCIKRLRPTLTRFPAVNYELCGLRILVEYDSALTGVTKGVYFARLIIDPGWLRRIANVVTAFDFEPGQIEKRMSGADLLATHGNSATTGNGHGCEVTVRQHGGDFLRASVRVDPDAPPRLTPGSVFIDLDEAAATYSDLSYGFIPVADGREVRILQIGDPHPDYVAWPLVPLNVDDAWVHALHEDGRFAGTAITLEPSYYVGSLPRYWRWQASERAPMRVARVARVPETESVT